MKSGLVMNQGRQLTVGPMLQRSLHFLQLNAIEFAQEVNALLDSNPLLEADESSVTGNVEIPADIAYDSRALDESSHDARDGAAETLASSGSFESWGQPGRHRDGEQIGDWVDAIPQGEDLRDHLKLQIAEMRLDSRLRVACAAIIDSLDERGYLEETVDQLREGFAESGLRLTRSDLNEAVAIVRQLEPIGMAAKDLPDCLSMQLAQMGDDDPAVVVARKMVADYLDLLGQSNFRQIGVRLDCSEELLREAVTVIQHLDPVPGRRFDNSRVEFVVPDVTVVKAGKRWVAIPTVGASPNIRLNESYASILNDHKESAGSTGLREKLQEARWLMRSIEQRNRTILAVGNAIVERQQGYFNYGDIALTPMTLADIAADVSAHESTISRVVTSKYLQCATGLKPMKMFFSSHVHTKAGATCSASAVKAMIQRIIENEPVESPISDHKLADLLSGRGVQIARRTVSKYRMAMGIQAYELRR